MFLIMKVYDLILTNEMHSQECYRFRLNFEKIFDFREVMNENEFIDYVQDMIASSKEDIDVVLQKIREAEIDCEEDENGLQIWKNNSMNFVLSKKGILKNSENSIGIYEKICQIKKDLLKNGIYIRIADYVS